jgi:hypothetical protein
MMLQRDSIQNYHRNRLHEYVDACQCGSTVENSFTDTTSNEREIGKNVGEISIIAAVKAILLGLKNTANHPIATISTLISVISILHA